MITIDIELFGLDLLITLTILGRGLYTHKVKTIPVIFKVKYFTHLCYNLIKYLGDVAMINLAGSVSDSLVDRELINFIEQKNLFDPREGSFLIKKHALISETVFLTAVYEHGTYLISIHLRCENCFDNHTNSSILADIEVDSYIYSLIAEKKFELMSFSINADTRIFKLSIDPRSPYISTTRNSIFALLKYCRVPKEIAIDGMKKFDSMN